MNSRDRKVLEDFYYNTAGNYFSTAEIQLKMFHVLRVISKQLLEADKVQREEEYVRNTDD